jgi:hypothetical protein
MTISPNTGLAIRHRSGTAAKEVAKPRSETDGAAGMSQLRSGLMPNPVRSASWDNRATQVSQCHGYRGSGQGSAQPVGGTSPHPVKLMHCSSPVQEVQGVLRFVGACPQNGSPLPSRITQKHWVEAPST